MIGNDPRYQTIIDAYKTGELASTAPQYNPIYDIRTEQIKAGDLPPGSQFPIPQLKTTPTTEAPKEPFDPCPPGYQLIDGVCQPDTMFQQGGGGGNGQTFTGPKITNGLIEGYEQVLSPGTGAMNSMQMMELEKRFGPEKAKEIGLLNQKYRNRGVQYDPINDRFVAMSPTLSQLGGDIAGGFSNILGGIGDAAKQYLSSGGLLGTLLSPFISKQPTATYGGSSDISVLTLPKQEGDILGSGQMSEEEAARLDEFINDTKSKTERQTISKMVKQGTGASGPPGRNYTVRSTPKKGTGASGPPGRNYTKTPTGINRPGR